MLINIKKSENIIKENFELMKEINKIKPEYKFNKIEISEDDLEEQLRSNIIGKYIIEGLKNEIKKMKYRYKITFGNNFIFIFSNNIIEDSIKLECLIKIILYLQKIGNNLILKGYFYLSPSTRKLHSNCFNTEAVNGGYTKLNQDRKLVVWRREDGIKVFIHELIHYFDIDGEFRIYRDINNYLSLTTNHDYVFEAFTDFFAINYYMIYLSLINNYSIEYMLKNFNEQYNFSLQQGFKVIKYSKLDEGKLIKNTTNVYCYYLLKLYIMIFLRNEDLHNLNIKEIIEESYKLYTNNLIKKYIKKIKLNNELNMAYKQIYL